MSYSRRALQGLAALHRERARLTRATAASGLLFLPAVLIALAGLPADWIFPLTLSAAYGLLIRLLASRLETASLLGLPAMHMLGQLSAPHVWLALPLLAWALWTMGRLSRIGLHKGAQFWVYSLLLGNMMPPLALPYWQHAGLMMAGVLYGILIGRHALAGWQRVLPGAAKDDSLRYARHLLAGVCLAWLAAVQLKLPHTWWLPIIVAGLLDPSPSRMRWLVRERVIGTLIGAALALLLAWCQLPPAWHLLTLCLGMSYALMKMQRSFRGFISGLTFVVLSVMPETLIRAGSLERLADTVLVGLLLMALAWRLERRMEDAAQDKAR